MATLDELLTGNEAKPAGERLTLIRVYEELRGRGFEGSYDAVRRYARSWAKGCGAVTAQAFVPLSFAAGEAYQFDWSHEIVVTPFFEFVISRSPVQSRVSAPVCRAAPSGFRNRSIRYFSRRSCRISASRLAAMNRSADSSPPQGSSIASV